MALIFVTRMIPESGLAMLREAGHEVVVSALDGVLSKDELVAALSARPYEGVLCLLTDTIDGVVFDAAPHAKIFANYAIGFNNIDLAEAHRRGITVTNTPGMAADSVAEYAVGLILAAAKRIPEGDRFTRAGNYRGWNPLLMMGLDLKGMTAGIVGAGRIGFRTGEILKKGFDMEIVYTDIQQSPEFEAVTGARFYAALDEMLPVCDVVSLNVPLLESTHHLINAKRLAAMKPNAILVNTSRGAVVDEAALVEALEKNIIRAAALDVFEHEPRLDPHLPKLEDAVLTPHIASSTEEARNQMSTTAALNLIGFFKGEAAPNAVA